MSIIKIQEELKAPKNQRNSFGNYNYRSAEDIIEAVKPIAHKYGFYLIISDEIVEIGGRIYVKATARLQPNETGNIYSATGWAREEETKKGMDGAQITGAASSYARKYALNGLLAIDDTKDPDATNTHDKTPNTEVVITQTDDKPWLNNKHPRWLDIIKAVKSGSVTIAQLREKYKVSKAIEAELNK